MTAQRHAALIRRLYDEVWNQGRCSVADELFADGYQAAVPGSPPGPEGEKRHIAMIRGAFPDLQVRVDQIVADGDTVAAHWTMTGTNTGRFLGWAATGKPATFWGVHFYRFEDDRIAACWTGVDMLGLLIQLGIVPSPWKSSDENGSRS